MLKRRIRILAVTGITIATAIVFTTLGATGARAASPAPASAAHAKNASATAGHTQSVIHSIHPGLVKDCVNIQLDVSGYELLDNGIGRPVTLANAPASCWNLVNSAYAVVNGHYYKGYEYQDVRGHCLWDNGGIIETAGTCQDLNIYETFYGIQYIPYHGWLWTNARGGPSYRVAPYLVDVGGIIGCADLGDQVQIVSSSALSSEACPYWNFPSHG